MLSEKNSLNKYQHVDRSILNWLKNAFMRQLLKFNTKRDNNIWIFGCWEGEKYSDNTKYLYQYVLKNDRDINCYWITKNLGVYTFLKSNNMPCVLYGTKDCKEIQLKAGICFYTNGIDDFGDVSYVHGAKIVCLMHGVSFKKLVMERDVNTSGLIKLLKKFKRKCYFQMYADYFFTSSNYMKMRMHKQFPNAALERIFVTGQPRNDVFFDKRKTICDCTKVLYMPTYRNNLASSNKLNVVLKELTTDVRFLNLLEKFNIKFVIKLHYLTPKVEIENIKNICVLSDNECGDVQELFLDTDILVTDYSSVANDFALLNRPIILFPFDKESYLDEEGFVDEFIDILEPKTTAYDVSEFCTILENVIMNRSVASAMLKKINSYFNDDAIKVGEFSKNVYETIINEIMKRQ